MFILADERNSFKMLGLEDYEEFLKYYTQIEYSYFKDGDKIPNQEERTLFITMMSEMICSRNVSKLGYKELLKQGEIYLYHTESGEVKGITLITPSKSRKNLIIQEFYVLREYQRQHIGTKMYQDFLRFLKEQGYGRVNIELQCSFEGAEEFWKSLGFKKSSKIVIMPGMEYRYYSKNERLSKLQ